MELAFEHDGAPGVIDIECVVNADPAALGCWDQAKGFPACTATVSYDRSGYAALFGWVQLVRSTDNTSHAAAFEIDPFALFFDSPSPYCWFGTTPTLFDAPSRLERRPMTWTAHSFLAATRLADALRTFERPVEPVIGFSWGFDIDDREQISIRPVARVSPDDWNAHLAVLRDRFPTWVFRNAKPDL